VCVEDWIGLYIDVGDGMGFWDAEDETGGERRVENDVELDVVRSDESGILVYVNALCKGCPVGGPGDVAGEAEACSTGWKEGLIGDLRSSVCGEDTQGYAVTK